MEETTMVGLRMELELLERVDRFAAQLEAQNPGLSVTRTNAIKALLKRALDRENIESTKKAKKAKP